MRDPHGRDRIDAPPRLEGEGAARRLAMPILDEVDGLAHAFTVVGSNEDAVLQGVAGRRVPFWTLRQVHGRDVRSIDEAGPRPWVPPLPEGDALVTRRRGDAIGVHVADCVPILLCDPAHGVIAAVHAGWRGTVARVLDAAIARMTAAGAIPDDLRVAMGPAIGVCCFEVGPDVVEALRHADPEADRSIHPGSRSHVDLLDANRRQAIAAGVREDRIAAAALCTACRPDLLISYRRGGPGSGRTTALIAWRA